MSEHTVTTDLEPAQWQQAVWRHTRHLDALQGNAEPCAPRVRDAIQLVVDYCRARLDGTATEEQRNAAWSAAWSAAAWSAAAPALRSAAASAAWSAASAAWSAVAPAASAEKSWTFWLEVTANA